MKKPFKVIPIATAAVFSLAFAAQSFAASSSATFTDLANVAGKDKIIALHQLGIISGFNPASFAPHSIITEAEGVQMIVKALGLNLDSVRFFKKPQATDYFVNANNDAWYADALITAAVNGLELPKDLDPNHKLTHEEFTHQLIRAIEVTGELPMIKLVPVNIKDEDEINTEYSGSIQRAINYGVVTLDPNGKFNPKKSVSRAEVAVEIYNAVDYMKKHPLPVNTPDASAEILTYADSAKLIAGLVGPDANLQTNVDPNAKMTRESFTYLLIHTLQTSGKLPMLNVVPAAIADDDQIDILKSGSIQVALSLGVMELDEEGKFNPKSELTRADAAEAISHASETLKKFSVK